MSVFPAKPARPVGPLPIDDTPGKNRLVQPTFGLPRPGRGRRPVVTETSLTTEDCNQIFGVVGDEATNGFYPSPVDKIYMGDIGAGTQVYVFELRTDKTLVELGNYDAGFSTGTAGGMSQVQDNEFLSAWRIASPFTGFFRGNTLGDAAMGDVTATISAGAERYHGPYYLWPAQTIVMNGSNHAFEGAEQTTYPGGTDTLVNSAKTEGDASRHLDMAIIGGPGDGMRARHGGGADPHTTYCSWHYNDGTTHNAVDADAVGVDLIHATWDGGTGNANTLTSTDAFDFPLASGVEAQLGATSFGNVMFQMDTTSPENTGIVPITWNGTTPTAGEYVQWKYWETYPLSGLWLGSINASLYNGSFFNKGEYKSQDEFNTWHTRVDGADVVVDTCRLKLFSDGSHRLTITNKDVVRVTGTSVITFHSTPVITRNGLDMCLLHGDPTSRFFHVKNAWG